MTTISNLDKYLYNVRRIEEHREETAVKELQKLYKQMIKDLRAKLGNVYADYADPDTGELTYTQLHKSGTDARLLEEIAAHVSSVSEQEAKLIKETVEQTYTNCYSGMIQAVESAVDDDSLAAAFASVSAAKPQALKAAVDNPVHGLTLSSQLEKNRADIIYTIKQTVGVGLSMGDRYDTMARRIQQSLIGDKKKAAGSYAKAIRIVRTEAHRCREQGNLDAAASLSEKLQPAGVTMMKTWHTMKDNRVRPQHRYMTKSGWKYSKKGKYNHEKMEGVSVPINEKFKLPSGAEADAPGKSGVAGEDINCRCFLSYTVERTKNAHGNESDIISTSVRGDSGKSVDSNSVQNLQTSKESAKISDVRKSLQSSKIEYREVQELPTTLTTDQIIARLGGGDLTDKGSCSSVALAYAGNKAGLDVLDFRGGDSGEFFAKPFNIRLIAQMDGVSSKIIRATDEIKGAVDLLQGMELNREYYFSVGKHAAIVRHMEGIGYQYLELQDSRDNGFKSLTAKTLKERFGAKRSKSSYGVKLSIMYP